MIDEMTEGCTSAEIQETRLAMSSQKNARGFARVARSRACGVETGNAKKSRIDLGEEIYKGKMTAFELDCNICERWLGWLSFCAEPPTSPRKRI